MSSLFNGSMGQSGVDTGDIPASLRFRSAASAYLSRTPASAGNRKTWTWSGWVRLGALSANQIIFNQGGVSSNYTLARLNSSNQLDFQSYGAASYNFQKVSSAVFRDPTAWYHVVFVLDATNTQARIYVNGNEVSYSTNTNPANADQPFNQAALHYIGAGTTPTQYFDGYISRICFVDGTALTPSSFGYLNSTINEWVSKSQSAVKAVVDAGGTNSFMLDFNDATSLTTLGYDKSSKGNNWTLNNFSLTAGTSYDWMLDVPGNSFATLNPLYAHPSGNINTLSKGNLQNDTPNSTGNAHKMWGYSSQIVTSGKWQVEVTNLTNFAVGICRNVNANTSGTGLDNSIRISSGAAPTVSDGASGTVSGTVPATSGTDVISLEFDVDAASITVYRNGTSVATVTGITYSATSRDSGGWLFIAGPATSTAVGVSNINFGQYPFTSTATYDSASGGYFHHTPTTGFKALCQRNMPDPAILNPEKHFDVVTYTGTAATKSITGLLFSPGLVEMKSRGRALDWAYYDSVRGVEKRLESNNTDAEVTGDTTGLTAFNSDGWTMGALDQINGTTATNSFVGSAWKAGGAAVTNNAGSISSQVSANVEAGFSIVTYTGTGANATVGHGLGKAPGLVIVKSRSFGGYSWTVYNQSLTAGYVLFMETTSAQTSRATAFNSTSPTSSVFSLGTDIGTNQNTSTFVAYCFAEIAGYSRIFSYTGNGSADGPFVHCGFKPKFVLIKSSSSATDWEIFDAARDPSNQMQYRLYPNSATAEAGSSGIDFTSNGFKPRVGTGTNINTTSATYIGIAFADVPAKYSLAR